LVSHVADQGSAAHPYIDSPRLVRGGEASRNLADVVHLLSVLHGLQPGVVDHAAEVTTDSSSRGWLRAVADRFMEERAFLARLAVAVGPLPSTPGAGDSDMVLQGQRHAVLMLSQSERQGCALGAAAALLLDWQSIRSVLDIAADRFGVALPSTPFISPADVRAAIDAAARSPSAERALLFGAEQILVQHYGLWDLLEARQQARAEG